MTAYGKLDQLACALDIEGACDLTVNKALTLHEAAAYLYAQTGRHLTAIRDALAAVDPALLANWSVQDGPALARVSDPGAPRVLDLSVIARQVGENTRVITERLSERLRHIEADPDAPAPTLSELPCGCPAAWGAVLRPAASARGQGLAHQLYQGTAAVVACLDCEHQTMFVYADQLDPEDEQRLWTDVRAGLPEMRFSLRAQPIRDLDGSVHGAILLGHNAATPAIDGALARGAARAAGVPAGPGELTVLCVTNDLAAIAAPAGDPELIRRALAAVARDAATDQHVRAPELSLVVTHAAAGPAAGHFEITELIAHPIDRILRRP